MSRAASLDAARARLAALQVGAAPVKAPLSLGDIRLDRVFPAGGLPLGCWHEVVGEALEIETAAASGAFAAALASPLAARGAVVWVMRRDDLYAPGLAGLGFPAHRVIHVSARDDAQVLATLEEALACAGVAVAIGEAGSVDLTAGRRLQLACERGGATGFVIRRRPFGGPVSRRIEGAAPGCGAGLGSAAATRWSIAPVPSESAAPDLTPGARNLGLPRWRASLERCRGGRPGRWVVEKTDQETGHAAHPLRVVADLGDRQLETPQPRRLAG